MYFKVFIERCIVKCNVQDWIKIQTIDNQPPILYLAIRLQSKDLKHLIPILVHLDYRVSIHKTKKNLTESYFSSFIFYIIVVSIEFSPLSTVELTTNWYHLYSMLI